MVILGGYFCWQENILDVYQTEFLFDLNVKTRTANLLSESIGFCRKNNITFLFYMEEEINRGNVSFPAVKNGLQGYLGER